MTVPLEHRGALTISIDLELAWGQWDKPTDGFLTQVRRLDRLVTRRLLELFERYDVQATWAIVAALLDPAAAAGHPGDTECWHAPDVIADIRRITPKQELGSHSFAHVYYEGLDRGSAKLDLERARSTHDTEGLPWGTFVFPRNRVGHLDLLKASGVRVFRGRDPDVAQAVRKRFGSRLARAANLIDKATPTPPPIVRPKLLDNGLVDLPGSMLWMSHNGPRRIIRPGVTEAKCAMGLERAARTAGVFHLWFHPINFFYDTERQLACFEDVLRRAADLREQGRLDILPMGAYAPPTIQA